MSSLWTPSGEHVPRNEPDARPRTPEAPEAPGAPADSSAPGSADARAAVDAMRAELAQTPAEVVVANHCYGLFELAAVYLSQVPPLLVESRLAVDALGAVLDALRGRLGEAEGALLESLSQLRLAYVRLEGVEHTSSERAAASDPGEGTTDQAS